MTGNQRFDLETRWAADLSTLSYERIPEATRHALKLLLLDSLGTALAAGTLGDGREQLSAYLRAQSPSDDCAVLGLGGRASVSSAAFVNGALVHALNFDALGAHGGHVGLAAVPAPLAFGERLGVSGKELLAAIGAGAEFTCRLAAALHRAGVRHGNRFLEGQVLGYFGATAAAAHPIMTVAASADFRARALNIAASFLRTFSRSLRCEPHKESRQFATLAQEVSSHGAGHSGDRRPGAHAFAPGQQSRMGIGQRCAHALAEQRGHVEGNVGVGIIAGQPGPVAQHLFHLV